MSLFKKKKTAPAVPPPPAGGAAANPAPAIAQPTATLPQGEDARAYQIIQGPYQTEKAARQMAWNKYVFRVTKPANQPEIKRAIEKLYKVKVVKVSVLNMPAKERRLGRQIGMRPGFKKAIVTLRAGDKIDLAV